MRVPGLILFPLIVLLLHGSAIAKDHGGGPPAGSEHGPPAPAAGAAHDRAVAPAPADAHGHSASEPKGHGHSDPPPKGHGRRPPEAAAPRPTDATRTASLRAAPLPAATTAGRAPVPVVAAPPPAPVDSSGGDRFVLRTLTASAPPAPALRQRPGADVGHLHHRAAMAAAAAWRQARTARAMPVATAVFPALLATRAATGERRARRVLGIPHWAALLAAAATLAGVGVLLLAAMPLPGLEDLDETVAPSSEVGATRR